MRTHCPVLCCDALCLGFGVGHARPAHLQGESEAAMAEEIEREITGGVLESDADNRWARPLGKGTCPPSSDWK